MIVGVAEDMRKRRVYPEGRVVPVVPTTDDPSDGISGDGDQDSPPATPTPQTSATETTAVAAAVAAAAAADAVANDDGNSPDSGEPSGDRRPGGAVPRLVRQGSALPSPAGIGACRSGWRDSGTTIGGLGGRLLDTHVQLTGLGSSQSTPDEEGTGGGGGGGDEDAAPLSMPRRRRPPRVRLGRLQSRLRALNLPPSSRVSPGAAISPSPSAADASFPATTPSTPSSLGSDGGGSDLADLRSTINAVVARVAGPASTPSPRSTPNAGTPVTPAAATTPGARAFRVGRGGGK